jgi:two-component system, cell cycle sensor histidine kinase and response regulator CckA
MKRILIVDDNPQDLSLLQTLLIKHGYGVTAAANGAEALEKARSERPDVIISDILMPIMDGFTLCREWNRDDRLKDVPFMFFSSTYNDPKDEKFALGLGAERFIVKPQDQQVLLGIIGEVISEHKAGRLVAPCEPQRDEAVCLREYNEVLIRKLEDKMVQVEGAKRRLELEVAERTRVEEALRASQKMTEEIINAIPVRVFWKDRNLMYLGCNSIFARDAGFTDPKDVIGKDDYQMVWREQAEMYRADDRQVIESGCSKLLIEEPQTTSEGNTITLLTSKIPLRDSKGEIGGMIGTYYDITDRKRSEAEKEKLQAQLQQAMKMEAVGRLAGGVAHDFNNLLTVIIGYSELLQQKVGKESPMHREVEEIKRAGERASSLTQQLLAFSRKQITEPKVVRPDLLVADMQAMLTRLIGEDIALQATTGISPGAVKVDPGQFQQILMNLVVNARDSMPDGGKIGIETVNVDLDEGYCAVHPYILPGRFVMLSVSDTGHGMSEEVKAHIFEPFFTTKERGRGTGLGLATTYGVVKQSGGSIEVYSEAGIGTTLKIYLPRVEGEAAQSVRDDRPQDMRGGSETVLLVEDEDIVRNLCVRILERLGYKVLQARNGAEAIVLVQGYGDRIDLLLTDVVMPGMNGAELARQLVLDHPERKVLFTSGYTDNAIVRHGILKEGVSFIGKPYTPSALAKKVRGVLDR